MTDEAEPGTRTSSMVPRAAGQHAISRMEDFTPERARAFAEDFRRTVRWGAWGLAATLIATSFAGVFTGASLLWAAVGPASVILVLASMGNELSLRRTMRNHDVDAALRPELRDRLYLGLARRLRPTLRQVWHGDSEIPNTEEEMVRALCAQRGDDASAAS